MSTYISAVIAASIAILLAAVISSAIKFEGGSNPKDPMKRRIVFWVFAVINPVVAWVLMKIVFIPSEKVNKKLFNEYNESILPAVCVGFIAYIVVGFVLSKVFKHGKLGHWF